MAMQDRAKTKHDLDKVSKIHQVLDKGSMVANAFFGKVYTQPLPGWTLHGYLSTIFARSCQDLEKIIAKILPRYYQESQYVMVRSYQESHIPKKSSFKIPFGQNKSERKSTKIYIYADLHC